MMKRFFASSLLGLVSLVTPAFGAFTYSAVQQFPNTPTLANVTTGVWSYGYATSLAPVNFTLYPFATTNYFGSPSGAVGFYTNSSNPSVGSYQLPGVLKNTASSPLNVSTIKNWTKNNLLMHPGANGQYSVVRFTAPTAAAYKISGHFVGLDKQGTTTDVHALATVGGTSVPLFTGVVTGFGGATNLPFSFTRTLFAGQTIDFAVGYGSNNNLYNDSTGFNAEVTPTPEPSLYGFLACGLGGLFVAVRRRRQA